MNFITSIFATFCLVFLFAYDFLTVCRIAKQEKFVEKIWRSLLPNKKYNEYIVFLIIRPIFLNVSFMCYILSANLLNDFLVYKVLIISAPILALINMFNQNTRK